MVKAWYMDNDTESDQRLEHHQNPPKYVSLEELKKKTGVLYWKLDVDHLEEEGKLAQIRKDRSYSYEDLVEITPEKLPNYEEKIKIFFIEHIHSDEEVRFVLEGSGYIDARDCNDVWIRMLIERGDFIVLPAGIYHRFTLDTKNYIKVHRLFAGVPVWTAINRPADNHQARMEYLKQMQIDCDG